MIYEKDWSFVLILMNIFNFLDSLRTTLIDSHELLCSISNMISPIITFSSFVLLHHQRVVESVGDGVHGLSTGDMVIPVFLPDCEECIDCKSKKSNMCSKFPFQISQWMPRDGTSRFTDLNGESLYHFLWISSFSEYTVLDVANVTKIDPTIPPNRACLLSCGVSTGNIVSIFLILECDTDWLNLQFCISCSLILVTSFKSCSSHGWLVKKYVS